MASRFSYRAPDEKAFLHTLRVYLEARGQNDVVALLEGTDCSIAPSTSYSGARWNALATTVVFYAAPDRLASFSGPVRRSLWLAADAVMPKDAGLDIERIDVVPFLQKPPVLDPRPLNAGVLAGAAALEHDGLRFRSPAEIRIYDALKQRPVLFFPNAAAVLGGRGGDKKEPDFLVCFQGRWGLLEVMGESFHPGATAFRDHDRARLFKDYGLLVVEFYDAARCCREPDAVVDDFLRRL